MEFLFSNDSTVESTNYSVGRHNSTRVDEGRKCRTLLPIENQGKCPSGEGERRVYYMTPDLSYDYLCIHRKEKNKKGEDNK